jgi:hypothetical protein
VCDRMYVGVCACVCMCLCGRMYMSGSVGVLH